MEIGKKADIVVIAPKGAAVAPWDASQITTGGIDPVSVVVHSGGDHVHSVLVDGEFLVKDGKLLHLDEVVIAERARKSVAGIRSRSGVGARNHQNLHYI